MASNRDSGRTWPAPVAAILLVALVVGASWWVGEYQTREQGFDWELAAIVCTGLGTTFLAAATGWLASSTRVDVRATTELARVTREQYAASERPIVLLQSGSYEHGPVGPGHVDYGRHEYYGQLAVHLVNVGLGPALRVRLKVTHRDDPTVVAAPIGEALGKFVLPGGTYSAAFLIRLPESPTSERLAGFSWQDFEISGTYLDRSQKRSYEVIAEWGIAPIEPIGFHAR